MSVHQLADGRWIVQYRDPDAPGKHKREYFGRGLDAEKEARDRNDALDLRGYERRTPARSAGPLFTVVAQAYLDAHAARWQATTYKMTLYKMRAAILPAFGYLETMRITPGRVDAYVNRRLDEGRTRSTVLREIGILSAAMAWAARREHIPKNPLDGYEKPKADDAVIQPPDADEIRRILAHSPPHLARAIRLLYYTGARPGREIQAVTWGHVDLSAGTIRITSAKKRGPAIRTLPIHEDFAGHLHQWRTEDAALPGRLDDLPLIHYRGRAVASLRRAWKTARRSAGITRRIRLYDLRHAFATDLLDDGADLKAVSEIIGHANPRTTLTVYQHTSAALHRATIGKRKKI